jgi:hypothetical protein
VTYRRTTTLTLLRVVEEFSDDEAPSLPPMPVVETDGIDVTDRPGLAKCGAVPARNKRSAAR